MTAPHLTASNKMEFRDPDPTFPYCIIKQTPGQIDRRGEILHLPKRFGDQYVLEGLVELIHPVTTGASLQ